MSTVEAFDHFHSASERCRGLWRSIDVSSLAAKRGGTLYNSITAVRLRPEVPEEIPKFQLIEVARLLAGRVTYPIAKLEEILTAIQSDRIPFGEVELSLENPPDPPGNQESFPTGKYNWYFRDLDAPQGSCWRATSPPSRSFELHGNSQSPMRRLWSNSEWKFLEDSLASNDPPAADLADLAQHVVRWDCGFDSWNTQPSVAIIAPLYSAFSPELIASKTSVTVRASGPGSASIDDFSIASVVRGQESIDRTLHRSGTLQVSAATPRLEFGVEIPAADGLWLDAILLFRGLQAGRITIPISSENPRILAHAHFDHEWGLINDALGQGQKQPDARKFEVGVGWLFHLLGFQVANFGLKELKPDEEVDILAFVPFRPKVLALEVTTRSPMNRDKLVKLRKRVDDLAPVLQGVEVVGAFVSAHPSPFDIEVTDAHSLGLGAIYGQDLDRLLQDAVSNRSADEFFEQLKRKLKDPNSPGVG
jgi:hypothetical protein